MIGPAMTEEPVVSVLKPPMKNPEVPKWRDANGLVDLIFRQGLLHRSSCLTRAATTRLATRGAMRCAP